MKKKRLQNIIHLSAKILIKEILDLYKFSETNSENEKIGRERENHSHISILAASDHIFVIDFM